jgi:hypothetical protein
MIGGYDIIVPFGVEPDEVGLILKEVLRFWPSAWYEDSEGSVAGPVPSISTPCTEFFLYRDEESKRRIDMEGVTEDLSPRLIYAMTNRTGMTFVVDAPGTETSKIVESIVADLQRSRSS